MAGLMEPSILMENQQEIHLELTGSNYTDPNTRNILEENGLSCVFQHHCAVYIETPDEIDLLMNRTDPALVGLCLDTGHYTYGGGDPIQGIENHASRIKHVHFKDFSKDLFRKVKEHQWGYFKAVENGIFCELGKGAIDFETVVQKLESIRYNSWIVVEQDVLPGMGFPKKNAKRNRQFLRSIGL